jgi:hypothetical protein
VDLLYFSKQIRHSFFKGFGDGVASVAADAADASVDRGFNDEMI